MMELKLSFHISVCPPLFAEVEVALVNLPQLSFPLAPVSDPLQAISKLTWHSPDSIPIDYDNCNVTHLILLSYT